MPSVSSRLMTRAEKQVRKQLRIAEKQVRNTTVFDNYLLKSKSAQTVHDLMSQDVDKEIAAKEIATAMHCCNENRLTPTD